MDATEAARREAERIHQAAVAEGDDPWNLLEFVIREAGRRELDVYALPQGDSALKNGRAVYDSQAGSILYEDIGSLFDRAFLIAHELGHVVLEGGAQDVVTEEVKPDRSAEDAPVGIEKVLDYGAKERREVRMDLFARELLLPRSVVRGHHIDDGCSSSDIARRLGAPLQVVQQQLLDALLLPMEPTSSVQPASAAVVLTPDPTQIAAVNHRNTAFQLQAGPGTGKTRTLVQRIENLLAEGVDPKSILVLTFSNKAANELNERLAANNPKAAAAMWIGTFHAFGLDIIRRFHDKLGLPADPRLIDRSEGIELLEDEFPRLALRHYRNLWDPALDLSDMLSAISRAKDEVIDAAGYRALAQFTAQNCAGDAEAAIRAEKCLEVALVYETYERLMMTKQLIDFGDLVAQPVRLVEGDAEVRNALKARHKHVLVDEYQDVNRSSVRLLKAIVGEGRDLWVVGDARQSIYRFRGASATNMAQFTLDFPGAQVDQLGVNYRSGQEIIDVFTAFSGTMKASTGALPLHLKANRGALTATPEFRIVGSTEDEISAIAAAIQAQQEAGTAYREQALLCASNARLSEIAEGLEARGIPVLHLGSLFERPEIKDLLALLSILSDPYAVGLMRAATMPAYKLPLQDVAQIIEQLRESKAAALDWRHSENWPPELIGASKAALARVADLFDGMSPTGNPWTILSIWVIDRLGLAKTLYLAGDAQSRMKGLALWQFLNFCRQQPSGAGTPCTRLLDRIRRLVLLSEDRGLRHVPGVVDGIDAVRLMTIHASKGLEFHTVHIPGMVTSGLPRNNMAPRCVPPDGLIHGSDGFTGLEAVKAGHDEEEECLFFVALSRARNRLFLYASSVQSDGRTRNPSKFIPSIRHLLTQPPNPPQRHAMPRPTAGLQVTWEQKPVWTDNQINLFERCPRRFLYTHVLKLGGRRTETAFMKMHNVVGDVFNWLKTAHEMTAPSEAELRAYFDQAWQAKGAVDHGYAEDYRRIARRLVDYLIEARSRGVLAPIAPISLGWAEGEILVRPDSVAQGNKGQIVIRRVKTGKPRSNAFDDIEYTLLHLATVQTYGESAQVEVTYLTSETTEPMSITERKLKARSEKVQEIVRRIRSGDFPVKEESRTCPRCPSFFVCGDLPAGAITIKKFDRLSGPGIDCD
ncbi:ImmA/IrrE family metallo-endopeptidase [Duganella sp. BJB488]|uniref:ATP-dependent helicase n=1 Tax=unclassified Duganella TaxID=2636909 RepID=UPI000E344B0D|nr:MULTISPECIES: ATP-dependent helicase [unclassified Duganella]RFP10381.1 ImmA/IrrE family metallo-endopeptidase [Duganella sp. BJB489]RFP18027.1 ImmA/IrrE family metallo-endopeptidase [Duganella sp. BJB488]RFP37782.1 ImmA/IrrE family metallo-endopeptidase [Duganella sp. BJB480]